MARDYIKRLHQLMDQHYTTMNDLKQLAKALDLDWNQLAGATKKKKIGSITRDLAEEGELKLLVDQLKRDYRRVSWPQVPTRNQQMRDVKAKVKAKPKVGPAPKESASQRFEREIGISIFHTKDFKARVQMQMERFGPSDNRNLLRRLIREDIHRLFYYRGINLSGQDLSNFRLMRLNFRNADLSNANLTKARFNGAILSEANLKGAIVKDTRFDRAVYDQFTQFPFGFDAKKEGMVFVKTVPKKKNLGQNGDEASNEWLGTIIIFVVLAIIAYFIFGVI